MPRPAILIALLAGLALSTPALSQQADSVTTRRNAERAQSRFELTRRQNLPFRHVAPPRPCEARIGRFCHWTSGSDTTRPPEPRVITRARDRLLAQLDSAAAKVPGDEWIAGQRVRYLLEADRDSAALEAARSCRASAWWCSALEGLAWHESGQAGLQPDSAFDRALRLMPESERCRWTDMTPILSPELRSRHSRVGCGRSEEVAERLWWLADPLWSHAGSERRSEHFARHTVARIMENARNPYGLRFANDYREMIVRYGWSRYWTRGEASRMEPGSPPVSGHEATPNYHFLPVSRIDSLLDVEYDLEKPASVERFASTISTRFEKLEPQVARFRRGDSSLVVAAWDVMGKAGFDSGLVSGHVIVSRDARPELRREGFASGPRGAAQISAPNEPAVVSVEVVAWNAKRATRMRRGIALPPRPAGIEMSDVLLFDPGADDVGSLDSALARALGSTAVRRGKVGLYWEIYGLPRADSALPVSLTLTRVTQGALRRLGESIGITSRASPLRIVWFDTSEWGSVTARAVVLDLSLVPRGRHVLEIQLGTPGKPVAGTRLEIQLEQP